MNYSEQKCSTLLSFIDKVRETSEGMHPRKYCFVLGAGASASSGIKTGQNLVDIWDQELSEQDINGYPKWKEKLGITEENKYSFYGEYYEQRFSENPMDGYNYMEKLMENKIPSIGYVILSFLLTKTQHNVVITTNFDSLLEDAIKDFTGIRPMVIGHESLAHYITVKCARPKIIKIHRDILFEPKSVPEETEELDEKWREGLEAIFKEYYPIFIGYAGNDNSLMDFLNKSACKFGNKKAQWNIPYWMVYGTDDVGADVLGYMKEARGTFVQHDGFDEVMYRLAVAWNCYEGKAHYKKMLMEKCDKSIENLEEQEFSVKERVKVGDLNELSDLFEKKYFGKGEYEEAYRKGEELYKEREYEKACIIGNKLYQKDPRNVLWVVLYGKALWMDAVSKKSAEEEDDPQRYKAAEKIMREAVEIEPQNADYHKWLGEILGDQGRHREARDEKEKAVAIDPSNVCYHQSLHVTYRELGVIE